jgi:mannose-6-phosphate isomerase-like protein (cupin superfamily)
MMKKYLKLYFFSSLIILPMLALLAFSRIRQQDDYILEHEQDVRKEEPGTHDGGGTTTAFSYFAKDKSAKFAFRKRILHPGSAIGYHLQEKQEVYYILSGDGILTMNGKEIPMHAGDALLTKPGSHHGLKPAGNQDLAVLITYEN